MRRLSVHILLLQAVVFAVCGCKSSGHVEVNDGVITVTGDLSTVRMLYEEESYTFSFEANRKWHIEVDGEDLDVWPLSGKKGNVEVMVSAPLPEEPLSSPVELGTVTIAIDDSDVREIVQIVRLPELKRGEKSMLAYFFGRSLRYYLTQNLRDMKSAVVDFALSGNSLVVFWQESDSSASIREIYIDETSRELREVTLESVDLPSDRLTAGMLGDNLRRMMEYAPAERYSVIFLGHSTAWLPEVNSPTQTYGLKSDSGFSLSLPLDDMITRTIGEDNVLLDISELAEGLRATDTVFDCLYFDVCFMASLEAVYELRDMASYVIASPCEIMGDGSPYKEQLRAMFEGDYRTVCDTYLDFYSDYFYPSGCLSVIDCSKLDALAGVVKRINSAPVNEDFDASAVQVYDGRDGRFFNRYAGHWFYDVEDYYSQFCADETLVSELRELLSECVTYSVHTPRFYSDYNLSFNAIERYCGITLTPDEQCIPTMDEESYDRLMLEFLNPALRETSWYKATH